MQEDQLQLILKQVDLSQGDESMGSEENDIVDYPSSANIDENQPFR